MRFKEYYLLEESKEKEVKVVFKETDGKSAFPENTVKAIKKHITKAANDLEMDWNSSAEITNTAFTELSVPQPIAGSGERWEQYIDILGHATTQLYKARGSEYSKFRRV